MINLPKLSPHNAKMSKMIWKGVKWELALVVFSRFLIISIALCATWHDNKTLLFLGVVFMGLVDLVNAFNVIRVLGGLLILQLIIFYSALREWINE